MKPVRVRFAPSPTGPLHIGGVRTALYNYLFAKKHNGTFILRIEDTDQTRYVDGAEDYIVESLKWCTINVDEGFSSDGKFGPYKQSERKEIYAKYAKTLVETNNAYYAFDTPEELSELRRVAEEKGDKFVYNYATRTQLKNSLTLSQQEVNELINNNTPYVIRFNTPEDVIIEMNDEIRGNIKVNSNTIDDKVLFKSDGLPTYHLANIVDDYLMQISHVIRGEEWLPSLPLHYMLYDAFGWSQDRPVFAHLPLILKPTGKGKLSKRDGDKMGFPVFPIEWIDKDNNVSKGYREEGYLPEAFINMLALLGWNPGNDKEIFSVNELVASFDLSKVHKAGARFDPEKAKWFNQKHLQRINDQDIAKEFGKELVSKGIKVDLAQITKVITLIKDRIQFVNQIWDNAYFFFEAPKEFNQKVVKKRWKNNIPDVMIQILKIIEEERDFDSALLKEKIAKFIEQNSYSFGGVMNSIRLSIVGGSTGPDLFSIIDVIGKDETVKRIKYALETLPK